MSEPYVRSRVRKRLHDCEAELARKIGGRRLRSCCISLAREVSRSKLLDLVREGIPHSVISVGPSGRVSRRFSLEEFDRWIDGRRERQIERTLSGERFARKGPA